MTDYRRLPARPVPEPAVPPPPSAPAPSASTGGSGYTFEGELAMLRDAAHGAARHTRKGRSGSLWLWVLALGVRLLLSAVLLVISLFHGLTVAGR